MIVNQLLERQYVKKVSPEGPELAKHPRPAIKFALLETFVIHQIYVRWVRTNPFFGIFIFYHYVNLSISVSCISNSDCEFETLVCKESVDGGQKICQASSTCTETCSSVEFCDSTNTCQDSKVNI
jgi:hypothetical protein